MESEKNLNPTDPETDASHKPAPETETEQTVAGYTLAEAAHLLQIHPSTLRFWEENFREELAIPRNWKGDPIFSENHLKTIRRIQHMVMGEGHTLAEARQAALSGEFPVADPSDMETFSPQPRPTAQAAPADSDDWRQELSEIRSALTLLTEHVAYLLEENRSFQELFARLVDLVENNQGSIQTTRSHGLRSSDDKPFIAQPPVAERIVDGTIVDQEEDPSVAGAIERTALTPAMKEAAVAKEDDEPDFGPLWPDEIPAGPSFEPGHIARTEDEKDAKTSPLPTPGDHTSDFSPFQPGRIVGGDVKKKETGANSPTPQVRSWNPGEFAPDFKDHAEMASKFIAEMKQQFHTD